MLTRREFMSGLSGLAAGAIASGAALGAQAKAGADTKTVGTGAEPIAESVETARETLRRWVNNGADWSQLRQHFLLDPSITYLNTGTLGACPRLVVESHQSLLQKLESNPAMLLFGSMGEEMETVRRKAAAFLGADLDEVALTPNTTTGMNLVASGLEWRAGDEVLTTNQEHPGGRVGWEWAQARHGVVIREIVLPSPAQNAGEIVAAFKKGLTERTKVISVSHVNTITGSRMPVAEVAKLARASGAFLIVDGAQVPGMLQVDVHALGCDAYASSSHKWMLAPKGSGLLYLRRDFQQKVKPVFLQSGMGAYTAATGTRNVPQILAHGVAMDFHNLIGKQRIEERDLALARRLRERLSSLKNLEVVSPAASALQSAIVSVKLRSRSGDEVASELFKRKKIVVKPIPGEHLDGRGIRISTHLYNTERELDALTQELEQITKNN